MRCWVVIAICLAAGTASADKADVLFKKGKKLLGEKRYAEACAAFEDSDKLDPGIGAKLNVARCYQEWGKLATAYRWYDDAERMARAANDERAPKIHALSEELDGSVPRLTVKAPPDADLVGVTITLDAAPMPVAELGVERRVDPGPHQIVYVVNARTLSKTVPVERGGSSEVTLELPTKATRLARRGHGGGASDSGEPGQTQRILGIAAAGAGLTAVVISVIVTYRARTDYDNAITNHCRGAKDMCDAEGLSTTHAARHRANIATAVTITGAVAIAGGAVLYLLAPRARSDEHAYYLAPAVSADGGTLVLGGAF